MYDVKITNNYIYSIFLDGGKKMIVPPNGGKAELNKWGSHILNVPGMGDINFIDLSETKLNQYTTPKLPWTEATWGGLIRYRSLDAYFRYEGQGKVDVVVDKWGSVALEFAKGGGMIVSLDDLIVV